MSKKERCLGKKRPTLQLIPVVNIDVPGSTFLMTMSFFIPYLGSNLLNFICLFVWLCHRKTMGSPG